MSYSTFLRTFIKHGPIAAETMAARADLTLAEIYALEMQARRDIAAHLNKGRK